MSCSARGHSSPYSSEYTWEDTDANLLTGNWANWLSMSREHWWDCGLHSVKYAKVGFHSSIMDDGWLLHPEKELSIFSLTCARGASAYVRFMKRTTYIFPLGAELLSCTWHTGTLFIPVWFYPSVSAPGDPQVTSDCPEAIFTVSVVGSTGYPSWSLMHL